MKKTPLQLRSEEQEKLTAILAKGQLVAKVFKRALALLELDRGHPLSAVAQRVGVSYPTLLSWRDKYVTEGLEAALYDAPRAGRPIEIDGVARAKITALACSPAPEGHARWSLNLLAAKAVEWEYCEHLSGTHVRTLLKKTNSNRT